MRVDATAGLLQLDEQLERAADQLSLIAMAVDGLQARCETAGEDIYAAQRLQDAAHRVRMSSATLSAVQAVLRTLAGDGDEADATADLGPLLGRAHAWTYGQPRHGEAGR